MDEEFDTLIHPHPPLPLPHMRYENHFEVDPIRIDPIINIVVRLDPITVHISRIGLLRAEAPVDIYVLNTGKPKYFDGGPQAFQEPTPSRSGTRTGFLFLPVLLDDYQAAGHPWSGRKPGSHHLHCCSDNP